MCIAIFKPQNIILTKSVLKTCFTNNPHGAGFAYPSDDSKTVIIEKGFFSFRYFWLKFRSIQSKKNPMLIHFRVATSGIIDETNCHPWRIDSEHALIHNGVVQHKIGISSDEYSDTGLFVKHVFQPTFSQNKDVWKTNAYKWLIEESIGKGNKMVVMDNQGNASIFNESEGEWAHGAWFSNQTYKISRKNIADITKKTWVESRKNGETFQVIKKGTLTRYVPIKNPLSIERENDKLCKFVKSQTGISINKTLELPAPSTGDENSDSSNELSRVLATAEIDIGAMY